MFERFTPAARTVVIHAQEASRELGHDYIGTEHLLLALAREPAFGLDREVLRDAVIARVGSADAFRSGQIPFTPNAKKALELSASAALSREHTHVVAAHIALALLKLDGSTGTQILVQNTDVDALRVRLEDAAAKQPAPRRNGELGLAEMLLRLTRSGGAVAAFLDEHDVTEREVRGLIERLD